MINYGTNYGETWNLRVADILHDYQDGNQIGWENEFAWLRLHDEARLDRLADSVQSFGFLSPINLGDDGRIWDGHHRLCVAVMLGIDRIPARDCWEEWEDEDEDEWEEWV